MKTIAIIPARYGSSRFPGKPLALLGGKPVIERVVRQAETVLDEVYVATDDNRIAQCVESFGGYPIMTRADHQSGTDRVCEALDKLGSDADVVINIQGDEPFVNRSQLETLISSFESPETQIATLRKTFSTIEEAKNPNSPKIVLDNEGYAMYFSRSVVPFIRGKDESEWLACYPFLKHIGLYAYRSDVLRRITRLPQSSLELAESLEQLRWLQNGYKIKVGITRIETVGIDTPADLERAEKFLLGQL